MQYKYFQNLYKKININVSILQKKNKSSNKAEILKNTGTAFSRRIPNIKSCLKYLNI